MRNLKIILGVGVLIVVVSLGWQIGSCEMANVQLQGDLRDLASQVGTRIGFSQPSSDEDLRNSVIRKARQYDIDLTPAQVTVQRTGSGDKSTVYLAVDYQAPIHLPGFSFSLHFTPSSAKKDS